MQNQETAQLQFSILDQIHSKLANTYLLSEYQHYPGYEAD